VLGLFYHAIIIMIIHYYWRTGIQVPDPSLGGINSSEKEIYIYLYCYTHTHIYSIHGGSVKSKPSCLCHIYLMPNHIIRKLSRYWENSTNNMIPTYRNILFNREKDMNVW